jgi:hypothetical protein
MVTQRWLPDEERSQPEHIRVNLSEMVELARVMRAETDVGLRPESERARTGLKEGVCFGVRSASGYVYGAKQRYHDSLTQALHQLTQYVRAADILADAAEKVARQYAHTDALTAARVADVERALAEALTAARALQTGRTGISPA